MTVKEMLGQRVNRRLAALKMKPEQLAVNLDVSAATIYNIKGGHGVRVERLPRLADLLGVTTDWLLGRGDEEAYDQDATPELAEAGRS